MDDGAVLLSADTARAFSLNDTGVILWEALDHFGEIEELTSLLCEAHADLPAGAAEREVRSFLQTLTRYGLVARARRSVEGRISKNPKIITELVGDELMIVSRPDRRVHLLNETGALLWDALDHFCTTAELEALLSEAWPDKAAAEIAAIVENFLSDLLDLGLISESE